MAFPPYFTTTVAPVLHNQGQPGQVCAAFQSSPRAVSTRWLISVMSGRVMSVRRILVNVLAGEIVGPDHGRRLPACRSTRTCISRPEVRLGRIPEGGTGPAPRCHSPPDTQLVGLEAAAAVPRLRRSAPVRGPRRASRAQQVAAGHRPAHRHGIVFQAAPVPFEADIAWPLPRHATIARASCAQAADTATSVGRIGTVPAAPEPSTAPCRFVDAAQPVGVDAVERQFRPVPAPLAVFASTAASVVGTHSMVAIPGANIPPLGPYRPRRNPIPRSPPPSARCPSS